MEEYERITNDIVRLKNYIRRWLKIYFPEYTKVIKMPFGKWSRKILKQMPLPENIMEIGLEKIKEIWKEEEIRFGAEKVYSLYKQAMKSIGIKEGTKASVRQLTYSPPK